MRIKTTFLAAMTIGLLLVVCISASSWAQGIRIGIIGDQTQAGKSDPYITLVQGVEILERENVDVVIHTGDLIEAGGQNESQYLAAFNRAVSLLEKLRVPWYLSPGDHDVNPPNYVPNSPDRTWEKYYQAAYGRRQPLVSEHLYYGFDLKGYHFISLHSVEHLWNDPRWGDVYLAQLSDNQYRWLSEDLEKHRSAKGIVVFMHQPLWYNWTGWRRVHELLRRYPVRIVVAGHFHYNQDEGQLDGIRYVIVGATGGSVKEGNARAGNVQHVSIMHVRGSKIVFKLIPVGSAGAIELGSRSDMDKVQAVDTMLSEKMYLFPSQNPLCSKDGAIFADGKLSPAKLQLIPIGNPIDLPLQVTVSLDSPSFTLKDPHFETGACQQISPQGECQLSASARLDYSNNSAIKFNDTLKPLWTASLSASGPVETGTSLTLNVRVLFQGERGDYYLERRPQTTITECK